MVAAVAAANVIHLAQSVPPAPVAVPASAFDPLSWHEERFAGFRKRAADHGVSGVIGYFGDTSDADDDYYYAQFALVPLVLDMDPQRHRWAVANLRTTSPATRLPANWRIVEDLGGGVLLLERLAQ